MTHNQKPSLRLLSEFKENKFVKKDLLDFSGYETINEAKKMLGLNKAADVYHYLLKDYNDTIKDINKVTIKKYEKEMGNLFAKQHKEKVLAKATKPKRIPKAKEIKEVLYENVIRIDNGLIDTNINYKINAIELKKIKKAMKEQQCLFQQKIEFFNDKGQVINKIINITEKDGKTYAYDFKTMTFETMAITKEFIEKIQSNMVFGGILYEEANGYIWKPEKLLEINENYYTVITTKSFAPVKSSGAKQTYAASDTGTCVYDGVVMYFISKMEKDKNAKAIYNKLMVNKVKYAKTYSDEEIESELAPFCNCSITIKNLINGIDKIFNQNSNNKFNIEFINTKYNHLDFYAVSGINIIDVSKELILEAKNKPFYIEKFGIIYTLDGTYRCELNRFQMVYSEWKTSIGYDKKFIYTDSDEYKMLTNYDYKLHTFINKFKIDDSLYYEQDLKKAYFNYSDKNYNSHYVGMPSGSFINVACNDNFNYQNICKKGFVGFYQIQIIDSKLDKRLGFENGTIHYLFTSMINLLLKNGVIIKFLNASYSLNTHIPFTNDFLQTECSKEFILLSEMMNELNIEPKDLVEEDKLIWNQPGGIKYYVKAFGLMLCENSTIDIQVKPLKCDINYYDTINDEDLIMFKDRDLIKIQNRNKKAKSYIHFGYAIHAYTQTIILEKLMQMDLNDVFGIKLDSIIIKNPSNKYESLFPPKSNKFQQKPSNIEKMLLKYDKYIDNDEVEVYNDDEQINDGYYRNYIVSSNISNLNFKLPFTQGGEYIEDRVLFIGGKGGSGKTSSCLATFNLNTTCYTTMCWNLIQNQISKYKGLMGHSIPQLTGGSEDFKCEKINNPNIKTIIIDEATLINKTDIDKIIDMYPNCFIIILGDIDYDGFYYQCSVIKSVINPSEKSLQYIQYLKSYRFSQELNDKLDILRLTMRTQKNISRGYWLNKIKQCSNNLFTSMQLEDVIFNDNDVGITAKNDVKQDNIYTKYFINKGTKPKYFIKTTNKNNGQLTGQELNEKPSHSNYEMKLFKTIHSFQGQELNHDNNIVIIIDSLFDENLLYTAFSRARRSDQIKIVYI